MFIKVVKYVLGFLGLCREVVVFLIWLGIGEMGYCLRFKNGFALR